MYYINYGPLLESLGAALMVALVQIALSRWSVSIANDKGYDVTWAATWGIVGGLLTIVVYALLPNRQPVAVREGRAGIVTNPPRPVLRALSDATCPLCGETIPEGGAAFADASDALVHWKCSEPQPNRAIPYPFTLPGPAFTRCDACHEPILEGDDGWYDPRGREFHGKCGTRPEEGEGTADVGQEAGTP